MLITIVFSQFPPFPLLGEDCAVGAVLSVLNPGETTWVTGDRLSPESIRRLDLLLDGKPLPLGGIRSPARRGS